MTRSTETSKVEFLGLRFARCDEKAAHAWVIDRLRDPTFAYVVTPNVDHVVRLHREARTPEGERLHQVYNDADLCVCDSRILALLAHWSGVELPVVTGSDLTARLLSTPLPDGTTIALIGGDEAQRKWLTAAQPKASIFQHRPPMGLRTDPVAQTAVTAFVEEVGAHLTLLTVGSPQSEIIARLIKSSGKVAGVCLCIGASLEFVSGAKQRAPRAIQALRMEWAFRLLNEPQRLWRRYLIEGPAIISIWRGWRQEKQRQSRSA